MYIFSYQKQIYFLGQDFTNIFNQEVIKGALNKFEYIFIMYFMQK